VVCAQEARAQEILQSAMRSGAIQAFYVFVVTFVLHDRSAIGFIESYKGAEHSGPEASPKPATAQHPSAVRAHGELLAGGHLQVSNVEQTEPHLASGTPGETTLATDPETAFLGTLSANAFLSAVLAIIERFVETGFFVDCSF